MIFYVTCIEVYIGVGGKYEKGKTKVKTRYSSKELLAQ